MLELIPKSSFFVKPSQSGEDPVRIEAKTHLEAAFYWEQEKKPRYEVELAVTNIEATEYIKVGYCHD